MIMIGFFAKLLKNEDGVAAIEFAMVAPFLILLMVGIMDMGMYIRDKMKLEQISRAGVDFVLQGGQDSDIESNVVSYYDPDNTTAYTVTSERVCTCGDGIAQDCTAMACPQGDHSRQFVKVDVSREFSTLFPYPGLPQTMTLSGSARMRLD